MSICIFIVLGNTRIYFTILFLNYCLQLDMLCVCCLFSFFFVNEFLNLKSIDHKSGGRQNITIADTFTSTCNISILELDIIKNNSRVVIYLSQLVLHFNCLILIFSLNLKPYNESK